MAGHPACSAARLCVDIELPRDLSLPSKSMVEIAPQI